MKKVQFVSLMTASLLTLRGIRYLYRKCFHHTMTSKAVEEIIKITSKKDAYTHPEAFERFLYEQSIENKKKYKLSHYMLSHVDETTFASQQLFVVRASKHPKYHIIYLHSGGFIQPISFYEWRFVDRLAKDLDACVYVPMYPLVPTATHEEAYDLLEKLYASIDRTLPLTIIGAGAGGALATGFCESLGSDLQPDRLILISPWLDLTMSRDGGHLEKIDPLLSSYGIKRLGTMWAGTKSLYAYKVSPYFGNYTCLSDVTLFGGTNELLYPDIVRFYRKLKAAHVNARLITGHHLIHNYPLLPIPEAKEAFEQIESTIKGSTRSERLNML